MGRLKFSPQYINCCEEYSTKLSLRWAPVPSFLF